MKVFLIMVLLLAGPTYTNVLDHIDCKNADKEHHVVHEDHEITWCSFEKYNTYIVWTKWKSGKVNCIAYKDGVQTECPEPEMVY